MLPAESTPNGDNKHPENGPMPIDYRPLGWFPYKVQDNDDWKSVAKRCSVDVKRLISFNCGWQTDPIHVNWYLHWRIGCKKLTKDKRNYRFSKEADPGIIWTPQRLQWIEVEKDKNGRWVEKKTLRAVIDSL